MARIRLVTKRARMTVHATTAGAAPAAPSARIASWLVRLLPARLGERLRLLGGILSRGLARVARLRGVSAAGGAAEKTTATASRTRSASAQTSAADAASAQASRKRGVKGAALTWTRAVARATVLTLSMVALRAWSASTTLAHAVACRLRAVKARSAEGAISAATAQRRRSVSAVADEASTASAHALRLRGLSAVGEEQTHSRGTALRLRGIRATARAVARGKALAAVEAGGGGDSPPATLGGKLIRWYDFNESGTVARPNMLGTGGDMGPDNNWVSLGDAPTGAGSRKEGGFPGMHAGNWESAQVFAFAAWTQRFADAPPGHHIQINNRFRVVVVDGGLYVQVYYNFNYRDQYSLGISDTAWHHICASFDSATRKLDAWVDGSHILDTTAPGSMAFGTQAFGCATTTSTPNTHGFASVQFGTQAWTAEEIAWLHNGGSGRLYAELTL